MKPITLNRTIQDKDFPRLIAQYKMDNKGKSYAKKYIQKLYEKQEWFCKNCLFFEIIDNLDEPYCGNEYYYCKSEDQRGCDFFTRRYYESKSDK